MKKIIIILIVIVFSQCTTKYIDRYIILRDIPDNPSFIVIPEFSYQHKQYEKGKQIANFIEEIILKFGLRAIVPPIKKEITEKKEATALKTSDEEARKTIIETYSIYESKADYAIYINIKENRLKIIKLATKDILTTFDIDSFFYHYMNKDEITKIMHKTLSSLGFKLRSKNKL